MKSKSVLSAFALLIVGIFLGVILISGFGIVRPGLADINLGASNPPVNLDADANSFSKAFIEVAEKVTPAIVQITVVSERENPHEEFFFFPFPDMPKEQRGSGSGIIISEDGYIITNNHVVENAKKVTVGLFDKRTYDATIIGTDPLTDLAVIKIDADNLTPAYLGDSDNLKVGQWVMAIGNPLSLASTVTAGIVSAIGRGQLGLIKDSYGVENFIQTDAAINPGNSGGALVDLSGAVIGVNSAIASGRTGTYIGYGFAIPINLAKSVAEDLITNGEVNRGYIGINIGEVDNAIAKSIGLDKPKGVIVQGLVQGGAAEESDIKPGDVILKVDNREVNAPNELQSYIVSRSAGDKVTLTLFRDGKIITRDVVLKSRGTDSNTKPVVNNENGGKSDDEVRNSATFESLGLTVRNLNTDELNTFKVDHGILISEVKPFSKAEDQRLVKGLIILEVDKEKIESVSQFKKIIEAKKGSAVLLKVQDANGTARFVGLEIPE
ncbi:MAG: trypsin-like peptidase domain-containing protein [Ignavibacteriaceae bacterium]